MFQQNALIAETGRLQKFALRLTRNNSDANDLVQATCLRAIEKNDHFLDGTNLFSWTSKIMYNLFISDYRRRVKFDHKFSPEIVLENYAVEPEQDKIMELSNVKRAMYYLSRDHRNILIWVCIEGMSYEEVGTMLSIPVGTVRSRLSRAREQLDVLMNAPAPTRQEKALLKTYIPDTGTNLDKKVLHVKEKAGTHAR